MTANHCSQEEMKILETYIGKWRIVEMDQWDQDFVDLVVPGHIKIQNDGTGSFQFGAVQGEMDCRIERFADQYVLGFSWDGSDECDPVSGRGWIQVNGNQMTGYIFFHFGEDSAFKAKKVK